MRVRHTSEGPARARSLGVTTTPGDVVDVDLAIGRRLIERTYIELPEDACTEQTNEGRVCGRDQPCHYHTEEE